MLPAVTDYRSHRRSNEQEMSDIVYKVDELSSSGRHIKVRPPHVIKHEHFSHPLVRFVGDLQGVYYEVFALLLVQSLHVHQAELLLSLLYARPVHHTLDLSVLLHLG